MGTTFTVCTLAAEISPDIRTVMRSVYETTEEYAKFVDDIVFPERAGARTTVNAVENGVKRHVPRSRRDRRRGHGTGGSGRPAGVRDAPRRDTETGREATPVRPRRATSMEPRHHLGRHRDST